MPARTHKECLDNTELILGQPLGPNVSSTFLGFNQACLYSTIPSPIFSSFHTRVLSLIQKNLLDHTHPVFASRYPLVAIERTLECSGLCQPPHRVSDSRGGIRIFPRNISLRMHRPSPFQSGGNNKYRDRSHHPAHYAAGDLHQPRGGLLLPDILSEACQILNLMPCTIDV